MRVLWVGVGVVDQDRINIRGKVTMSLFVFSSPMIFRFCVLVGIAKISGATLSVFLSRFELTKGVALGLGLGFVYGKG